MPSFFADPRGSTDDRLCTGSMIASPCTVSDSQGAVGKKQGATSRSRVPGRDKSGHRSSESAMTELFLS